MGMGPCCCFSSRIGSVVISLLEIVLSIGLIALLATGHLALQEDNAAVVIIQYVLYLFQFGLGILLIIGTLRKSLQLLKIWFGVRAVTLTIFVISFTVLLCTSHVSTESILVFVIIIAMTLWFVIVVFDYLAQVSRSSGQSLEEQYPPNQA